MRIKKSAKNNPADVAGKEYFDLNRTLPTYSYSPSRQNELPQQPIEPKKKRSTKKIIKRVILVLFIIALLIGGWVGWKFLSNSAKIFGWGNLLSLLHSTKLKGEDTGHVNILLAGNSADDPGHGGANLTDSIMVMSIDTRDKKNYKATLISVPRDLYVNIPGFNYAKINETYPDGESENFSESGYANGGMGLLEKVVSQKLGITINYYALIDYSALRDAVNAVGGVTVNIQSSDPRGLYDPSPDLTTGQPLVNLTNGEHTLNGEQALDLARARGDSYRSYGYAQSDFERTKNQRLLIVALKEKAGSLGSLSNPITLSKLADSFGNNVKTDMKPDEVKRLFTITKSMPSNNIISAGLNDANGTNLLTSYTTRFGQSALVPKAGIDDYSQIQAYISQITGISTQ
jgi:LCP family protein required for cell wall assembly